MKTKILALVLGAALMTSGAALAQPAAAPASAPAAAPAPLSPPLVAKGDLMNTIIMDGRFKVLVKGLEDTNLVALLKSAPNITLFAPTDAAFSALPAGQLDALSNDKAAMQQLLILHMINAPVESSKIKGAKGPLKTVGGKPILLDGSEETVLKAGGAAIVQADLKPSTGLIQVVDAILQPDATPVEPAAN